MQKNSIGLIELSSIAAGYLVADAMLKAAEVEIMLSRTICSGKYMVLVGGDVAAVTAAWRRAPRSARVSVIDTFVIPNVHPSVFPAIGGTVNVDVAGGARHHRVVLRRVA